MFKPDLDSVKSTVHTRFLFPKDVIIETTAYCNLRCIMCPQKLLTRPRGEMDFPVFKKIIDEVALENTKSRIWLAVMGEPLLTGNKLIDMIKYAKGKMLEVHLNTNAELLTEDMADKLISSGLDEIIIGLDATTKETYDKVRVGGNFDKVVRNVKYLLRTKNDKPNVVMQFIVMDENEHEAEVFKDNWLKNGTTVKLRQKLGWGNGVSADNLDPTKITRFPCAWLARTVSIHWTGKFAQCDGDWDGKYSPGDINTQTIKEVWLGELEKRRMRHLSNDYGHELCTICKDWMAGRSQFFYPEKEQ